ncbi:hypothetical protein [Nitrosococcus wardiae]|uniref:hypothetical protein n=1 Tax=Nitrosococcus wardiae TaxID=1814290 RepID=UPI001980F078|nr:hypothetical protein [Nitrosococcus wardiae]
MSVEQTHPLALKQYCRNLVETKAFERFMAVVLNNLEAAKREHLEELRYSPKVEELLAELRETQATLGRLQERLETVTRTRLEEIKERPLD